MAIHYKEGEKKVRPYLYQRQSNIGFSTPSAAQDGICAIAIKASWGPLGKVVKNTMSSDLDKNYGTGDYSAAFTVPAAAEMFNGGAAVVYTYRMGTGGKQATLSADGLIITAKYPGTMAISVAVQEKLGDNTKKQFMVYAGTKLVEEYEFAADGKNEGANLIAEVKESKYIVITGTAASVAVLPVASGALTGGENPTVATEDYSAAWAALETYYYNCIALDVDDDESLTLSQMLHEYLVNANPLGKLGMAVVGEKSTVDFEKRCKNAAAFNDCTVVYLGGGWKSGKTNMDGALAICHTAGVIATTPSNQGIVHAAISNATELCESITHAQYVEAIKCGMLLVSQSPDGVIWYDSGINTLITPEVTTQDAGWKKIRRTKTRFEMFDRLNRELMPKVGRVSADKDGVADIIQAGQRVLDAMVNERKLNTGAAFFEDPENPYDADSAWFIVQSDDIDSLEKIYEHFQFRYSQNS